MDFIKKNWGLVLCSAIFLAVVGFLGVMIYSERQKYNASEKAISTLDGNFSKMNKAGWKVDRKRENAIVAEKNADVAKGHYDDIVRKLFEHSAFELPELPENYITAQERLDSELRAMQVEVLREKINWQEAVMDSSTRRPGGRFIALSKQATPIPNADFPAIFRQMLIYKKLVSHIIGANIKTVNAVSFPRWLKTEDAGEYTITPVIISVESDLKNIQKLVNGLTNDATMLFVIRSMNFSVPNTADDSGRGSFNEAAVEQGQLVDEKNRERLSEMGGQPGGGDFSRRSGMSSRTQSGRIGGRNEDGLVEEEPKRQDYLVLRSPYIVRLDLNLDLLEYKNPSDD